MISLLSRLAYLLEHDKHVCGSHPAIQEEMCIWEQRIFPRIQAGSGKGAYLQTLMGWHTKLCRQATR